jgi:hypothetical protein
MSPPQVAGASTGCALAFSEKMTNAKATSSHHVEPTALNRLVPRFVELGDP